MTNEIEAGQPDRRQFLKESATSVGAFALGGAYVPPSAQGANDTLRLGIVGAGSRGGTLVSWAQKLAPQHNVRFTAVCDLWPKRVHQAARRIEESCGRAPARCRTPGELFDRPDVDAVLIATPDFQHSYLAAQAVLAGKDVYVEKPFGCDFDQVKQARAIIAQSDRIVQVGTQSRGSGKFYAAADFVQSGKLGQVTFVEIAEPIFQQRWRVPGSEGSLRPGDVDWHEYLCFLPPSLPFDARHYCEFRLFWPFSSGPFCQWMSHRIDLVNLVLGKQPVAAVALGGVFLWKDGRTNPDTVHCLLEYPGGVMASYHMRMGNSQHGRGITIYGTSGTLELDKGLAYGNGGKGLVVEAERTNGIQGYRIDDTRRLRERKAGGVSIESGETVDYLAHFFDCVRRRRQPRGDVQAGYAHSLAAILANLSYRSGQKMIYDAERESIRAAADPVAPGVRVAT